LPAFRGVAPILSHLLSLGVLSRFGDNEKRLETILKHLIGDVIFPELLAFGNERSLQREADLFAVGSKGELVVIEIKVGGLYDEQKIYQVMQYAQSFSHWRYDEMNDQYRKCFPSAAGSLMDRFGEHFGYRIETSEFNSRQKMIVISNSSSPRTVSAAGYWHLLGIDIKEYFYRFYQVGNESMLEISGELCAPSAAGHCWVNTDRTCFSTAYLDMVKNRKAAAHGDRGCVIGQWMERGIIGAGRGTARISEGFNQELDVEERSIALKDFVHGVDLQTGAILRSISAPRLKQLFAQDFYFANIIVSLPKEGARQLYQECGSLFGSQGGQPAANLVEGGGA